MSTAQQQIIYTLAATRRMAETFVGDLSPEEMLYRPVPKANCTAWQLGHMTLSLSGAFKRLGAEPPALPDGFADRFARNDTAPFASEYGDTSILLPTFNTALDSLIAAVQRATPEQLDAPVDKPHPMFKTVGEFVTFVAGLHLVIHIGQITLLRRQLGRQPLI